MRYLIYRKEGRKDIGFGWYPTYDEALKNVPSGYGRIWRIKRLSEK